MGESVRVVSFKVEEDLLEAIDTLASMKGKTRSELIREALRLYLKLEEYKVRPQPRFVRLLS